MCVKLRKSTVVVIITSWILFFIAAFLAYAKLDQMKQDLQMKRFFNKQHKRIPHKALSEKQMMQRKRRRKIQRLRKKQLRIL